MDSIKLSELINFIFSATDVNDFTSNRLLAHIVKQRYNKNIYIHISWLEYDHDSPRYNKKYNKRRIRMELTPDYLNENNYKIKWIDVKPLNLQTNYDVKTLYSYLINDFRIVKDIDIKKE